MNFKIVTDSSADILKLSNIPFESAPLKIITSQNEYVDNADLDVRLMVDELGKYKGKSSTSCPNPSDWLDTFGNAERVFCVTITGTLSGSFNAAISAKKVYEEMYPERRVFVLDSLTAGPEMYLIIEKIKELILENPDFDKICDSIPQYCNQTGLIFMLESMKNLSNNGRVSPLVAKMAGLLGIRVVGKASSKGDLEPINKCRGEEKALQTILEHLKEQGLKNGKVRIAHCFNETAAQKLKDLIEKELNNVNVKIYNCRGLCSFYAEKGGMLIGYEKF